MVQDKLFRTTLLGTTIFQPGRNIVLASQLSQCHIIMSFYLSCQAQQQRMPPNDYLIPKKGATSTTFTKSQYLAKKYARKLFLLHLVPTNLLHYFKHNWAIKEAILVMHNPNGNNDSTEHCWNTC